MKTLKINNNLFIIFIIGILFTPLKAQKNITDIDSLTRDLSFFLYENKDGNLESSIFIHDCLTDKIIHKNQILHKNGIYKFETFILPRYSHLLVVYNNVYYIINMREKYENIIKQIKSIPHLPVDFFNECIIAAEKMYKSNIEFNKIYNKKFTIEIIEYNFE